MLRSDHMLGPAAVHFLLSKLVHAGPVLSYNLLFLAAFALSGWTTCLVLRAAGTSWLAAFLGGLCFSFSPARWEQASHLQVLLAPALWPALWWFHRFLETGRIGKGLLFSVAYVAQMVCGNYLAYFLNLGLLALCLYHFAVRGRELLSARRIASNLGVVLLCIAPVMPLYAPYALHGPPELEWKIDELRDFHPSLISFLTTSPRTGCYPELMTRSYRSENALFPGAVALGLASAATCVTSRAPARAVWRKLLSSGPRTRE